MSAIDFATKEKWIEEIHAWIDLRRSHGAQASEAERTVRYTWMAMQIVRSGGFRFLLEGMFEGDDDFQRTSSSFHAIGAEGAWRAFRCLLDRFPGGHLHPTLEERVHYYVELEAEWRAEVDAAFVYEYADFVDKLYAYCIECVGS